MKTSHCYTKMRFVFSFMKCIHVFIYWKRPQNITLAVLASCMCDLSSCIRFHTQKKLVFGFMFCHCHVRILKNFTVELKFCKWCLMGQWVCVRPEKRNEICGSAFLTVHLLIMFWFSMSTEFWWIHDVWEFSETQNKHRVSMTHLQLNKQGCWQPQVALLSVCIRTCSECKKKTKVF